MSQVQMLFTVTVDDLSEELVQHCFDTVDGYKVCDLVRRGKAKKLTPTKSGKWWKFPLLNQKWRKKSKSETLTRLTLPPQVTVTRS